jgi:hypothetical protein
MRLMILNVSAALSNLKEPLKTEVFRSSFNDSEKQAKNSSPGT